jgi:hypothetical protein
MELIEQAVAEGWALQRIADAMHLSRKRVAQLVRPPLRTHRPQLFELIVNDEVAGPALDFWLAEHEHASSDEVLAKLENLYAELTDRSAA